VHLFDEGDAHDLMAE